VHIAAGPDIELGRRARPPPGRPHAPRADRRAIPANDIDEIAVERAVAGDHITYDDLTAAEQQEVVRRLTTRGASVRGIPAQLNTTKRTVSRRRASLGAA
jgi:DNA-binding NarL/FixJ family response regulator